MRRAVEYEKKNPHSSKRGSKQLDASPAVHNAVQNSLWADFKQGVQTLTRGAPESFTLKELIQDDDSYFRELAKKHLKPPRGSRDDRSIGTASLENLESTLQRYSSRVGGQSGFGSGEVLELFDEISSDDNTYVTETTAGFGDQHKNYKPDLGN